MVREQINFYCYGMGFVLKITNTTLTILGYYYLILFKKINKVMDEQKPYFTYW